MNVADSIQGRWKGLFPDTMGLELTDVTPERVRATAARVTDSSGVELRLASQDEASPWLEVARC